MHSKTLAKTMELGGFFGIFHNEFYIIIKLEPGINCKGTK